MILFGEQPAAPSVDVKAFQFWQGVLESAFELPHPRAMPRLQLSPDARVACSKFESVLQELFSHTTFEVGGGFQVTIGEGGIEESVTPLAAAPSTEAVRSTLVAFRLLHSHGEACSFKALLRDMQAACSRLPADERSRAASILRFAKQTDNELRRRYLKDIARCRLMIHRGMPPDAVEDLHHEYTPEQIVRVFAYGVGIHWGDERENYEALAATDFEHASASQDLIEAIRGVMQFYFWFMMICHVVLRDAEYRTTPPTSATPAHAAQVQTRGGTA